MNGVLILNAGSSSLKFKLYNKETLQDIASGQFSKTNTNNPNYKIKIGNTNKNQDLSTKLTMKDMLNLLNNEITNDFPNIKIVAIGHRVVHGGDVYTKPTLINQTVIDTLKSITYLTPIHLPHNIAPMEVCNDSFKNIPQVACFDTSFHSTISKLNSTYPIPRKITEENKIKRYGFHGLSYEYIINKFNETHPDLVNKKIIIAHLGAGASIAAIENKKSIDTTMGLTPLEGLMMATRCGSIDPSIILYLMKKGHTYEEIQDIVYFQSGLLGVSEITGDFYTLSKSTETKAIEAFNMFAHSVCKNLLSVAASIDGIDIIIFTGGIGENSCELRKKVVTNLSWLGIILDEISNHNNKNLITRDDSKIKSFVIPTNEELMIAEHTLNLLNN